MFYMEEVVQFKDPINFSTEMYYVPPNCNFQNKSYVTNTLESQQDVVLAKLRVLMNNVEKAVVEANIKLDINENNFEHLIKMQENILKRLRILLSKLKDVSLDPNIDMLTRYSIQELENLQCDLKKKINDWKFNVENLTLENQAVVFEKVSTSNISIFISSIKPPLSVLLLLEFLKNKGHKVAVVSYVKKIDANNKALRINDYINNNLSLNGTRQSYKLILSIIWKNLDIDDCICQSEIFNNTPIFGEMMAFIYLCKFFNIDISKFLIHVESINDDLLYHNNIKRALILLNKLSTEVNDNTESNLAFSAFVLSCLVQSKNIDKISKSLKENLNNVLEKYACEATNFINMMQ